MEQPLNELRERIQKLVEENERYHEGLTKLKTYLESTIPRIPSNEKPLILTESLRIIDKTLGSESDD